MGDSLTIELRRGIWNLGCDEFEQCSGGRGHGGRRLEEKDKTRQDKTIQDNTNLHTLHTLHSGLVARFRNRAATRLCSSVYVCWLVGR